MKSKIEYRKLTDIIPYEHNPRLNDNAVEKVARSISEFGFNVPILIDRESVIVAGHTRYLAAQSLGISEVPCIVLDELDEEKVRQYRIIDNKTQELGIGDYEKLIDELYDIKELDMSIFDFGSLDEEADEELDEEDSRLTSNLDQSFEIDIDDFGDEAFEYECPYCGFKWNE